MNHNYQDISPSTHLLSSYKPFTSYQFAKNYQDAPILHAELGHALPYYPLCFKKAETKSTYELVALLSLTPSLNIYVDQNGSWLAPYAPSFFRSYPFRLNPEAKEQIQVDIDSNLVVENHTPEAHRLYTSDGELSQNLANILNFLNQREINHAQTQALIEALANQNLIVPWNLATKQTQESEPTQIEGYYIIDEAAINKLSGENISALAQQGALKLAYAQLLSMTRINDFRVRYAKLQKPQESRENLDLDKFFSENDTIRF